MARRSFQKAKDRIRKEKEFEEEVIEVARVTRVVKGGRRLRFRACVVIGDKKGKVGMGLGKAAEVSKAIEKATKKAKKKLLKVEIINGTISYEKKIKFKSAKITILPAGPGTGIIAGGAARKVLELAGIKNVLSKSFGSRNKVSTAYAVIKLLETLKNTRQAEKNI